MKTIILLVSYILIALSMGTTAPLMAEEKMGQPPYLPLVMRAIVTTYVTPLGEFTSDDFDDVLGYRAFWGGKINSTPELLVIDQRKGFMQVEVARGDVELTLKLWPIKDDSLKDDSFLDISRWLAAFTELSCGTMDCNQVIRFYRIYRNEIPYFEPVSFKEVLPVLSENDFFKPGTSNKPCFYSDVSYLNFHLDRNSSTIKVDLLKDLHGYFVSAGCEDRFKPGYIELEWTGTKFKKRRIVKNRKPLKGQP